MYCTFTHKRVRCPLWLDEITVTAKYRYTDEPDSYIARFWSATCEVQENLRLPMPKRDPRLALYGFCDRGFSCPCLRGFPAEIDVRTPP